MGGRVKEEWEGGRREEGRQGTEGKSEGRRERSDEKGGGREE